MDNRGRDIEEGLPLQFCMNALQTVMVEKLTVKPIAYKYGGDI